MLVLVLVVEAQSRGLLLGLWNLASFLFCGSVRIFLKLALEQSERFCSLKTKLMKKAKRKAKKVR